MSDLISRQAALAYPLSWEHYDKEHGDMKFICGVESYREYIEHLPSTQPETCEGCKHWGKWENEVEYGYPSPCTRCKRRAGDHYER